MWSHCGSHQKFHAWGFQVAVRVHSRVVHVQNVSIFRDIHIQAFGSSDRVGPGEQNIIPPYFECAPISRLGLADVYGFSRVLGQEYANETKHGSIVCSVP